MPDFESPTYALDLRNRSNCSTIESAKAGKTIRVLVRSEDDPTAKPIVAKGTRSHDGASFSVVVTRADGAQQHHDWGYKDLLKAISVHKPD